MAQQVDEHIGTSSNNLPHQHHFVPLPSTNFSTTTNEPEEWEYEYSSTETEIYYLTVDLTTPSIPCARPHIPRVGRGGHRLAWINSSNRCPKGHLEAKPTISIPKPDVATSVQSPAQTPTSAPPSPTFAGDNNVEEDGGDENDEAEEEQESMHNSGEARKAAQELSDFTTAKKPERIQILDLHSENPIITYKAHTFSCAWAENIGTELLFTSHDPGRPLPVLRSLADDVELLAASSMRIISKPIKIIPKVPALGHSDAEFEQGRKNRGFMQENSNGITIQIGSGASESRKEQARFLERMMEIKQKKGEKDSVTIVAQRRLYPAGWRAILKEKRAAERAQLLSVIKNGGGDVQQAAKRLQEIEKEEKVADEAEELRKESGLLKKSTAGRKPKEIESGPPAKRAKGTPVFRRPRGGRAALNLFDSDSPSISAPVIAGGDEPDRLSTPTPQRWGELQGYEHFWEGLKKPEPDLLP